MTFDATFATDALLTDARAWLAQDPDDETRIELSALIEAAGAGSSEAIDDLHSRFDTRLEFGTAGLRGEIAAGPNRMNRVLVAQAAVGFANFLLERAGAGAGAGAQPASGSPSVVIGYDGRKNSEVFARDSAELMAGAGIRAILLPRLLPTPVLAFAVRHLAATAGIMVTASHNPPNDNGYKVYLGGDDAGSQIVPPVDADIAAHIERVAAGTIVGLPRSQQFELAPESVVDAYVEATAAVATQAANADVAGAVAADADPAGAQRVAFTYTALHGVGWETASRVFERAGFASPSLVTEQIEPDAAFPTVAFPNPEEPGAMDLAFRTAREARSELIVANDPDADRLAIAIPDAASADGYRRLSGNEVGALLGWRAAVIAEANASSDSRAVGTLACSIVSSPALAAVAEHFGLDFADTLTGFKWVSRAPGLVFGFEEALGYLVNPGTVRDKDGISAAVALLDLATTLKAEGATIADQLDRFSETFGHFASDQLSLRVTDLDDIATIMARLRATPPSAIGNIQVARIEDLIEGFGALPPSDVLRIVLVDGSRVMVRPSGTEPKLKVYIDASCATGTLADRRAEAETRVRALTAGMKTLLGS